ncbi:MAG: archaeal proteasome endopeptidase complex subunit beta [Candidatus Hermodarchaeota archaeon]
MPDTNNLFRNIEKAQEILRTGTTTIGIKCKDGIVLASDKQATAGLLVASKTAQKIFKLGDYVAATIAGGVADAQNVMDVMKAEINLFFFREGRRMHVKSIATVMSNMLFGARYFPYILQSIVGGYDTAPQIFTLDPYGSRMEEETITATGSGSPVAYGVLEDAYHPELTVKEGLLVGLRAVHAAIIRDAATGYGFNLCGITKDACKIYSDEEINKMIKEIKK